MNVISAISKYDAPIAISENPAYSPADALHKALAMNDWIGESPAFDAAIPRENDTAKYPSPIGIPADIPSRISLLFLVLSFIYTPEDPRFTYQVAPDRIAYSIHYLNSYFTTNISDCKVI
jgi:hypothetical protein